MPGAALSACPSADQELFSFQQDVAATKKNPMCWLRRAEEVLVASERLSRSTRALEAHHTGLARAVRGGFVPLTLSCFVVARRFLCSCMRGCVNMQATRFLCT